MATKRKRPRRRGKKRTGPFLKNGRLQWLNLLIVCLVLFGLGWFVKHGWEAKPAATATATSAVTTRSGFIKKLAPEAQAVQKQYHVLASISLSQAILESDWGQSTNATENNNLFGVKAYATQAGRLMTTQEYYDGAYHTVKRRFAVYDSWHDSLVAHAKKLANGTPWDAQHYAAVTAATDYQTAAKALQTAGYATDPTYAQKLINIIQKYDLQRYDRE
ncbi:cell wall hydrolase [Lactiplantibacillus garii]|uniref:Cell wall hydrolase n=1 Tax=Lactiplantibacillus garii TaxID=2306423 RepID=A0A3R8L016_9LACO|nr:glycoside hydrolase family 73 protein [Lactiplantibacillus garii]RRK09819.1 cell wall hydrolase [Lactiplantibacillus garii]